MAQLRTDYIATWPIGRNAPSTALPRQAAQPPQSQAFTEAWGIPIGLAASGFILADRWGLSRANANWRKKYREGDPVHDLPVIPGVKRPKPRHHLRGVDDAMQYLPIACAVIMKLADVPGRTTGSDFYESAAGAGILALTMVNWIKFQELSLRPDFSNANSFPSGHTATAFMGAEILRLEYGSRNRNSRGMAGVGCPTLDRLLYPRVRSAVHPDATGGSRTKPTDGDPLA